MRKEFQRLYNLEWQLYDALKMLSGSAQNRELRDLLEAHRAETKTQMDRLDLIGTRHGIPMIGLPNLPMKALAVELLEDWGGAEPGPVTDAMIIGAAQKGEHLEIAWYGMLRNWCLREGYDEAADLLQQSLDEEKATDQRLTEIAEAGVNQTAASVR